MPRKMQMLTALAAADFSYAPGEVIELDDAIADAWKEAGTVREVADTQLAGDQIARLQAQLADVTLARDSFEKAMTEARAAIATAKADKDGANKERDVVRKAADEARARVTDLETQLSAARDENARITAERDTFAAQAKDLADKIAAGLPASQSTEQPQG